MPALPPVARVLKLRFSGLNQGSPFQHVMYLQYSGVTVISGDINSICNQAGAAWANNLASLHATAVTINLIEGVDLSSASGASGSNNTVRTGTRAGTNFPVSAAGVASWKVQFHWRGGHPRTYFPMGVAGDVTNGRLWTPAFSTAAATAINAFLLGMNTITIGGNTNSLVCVRYFSNHQLLAVPIVLPITTGVFHGRMDTQRRRLGRELS